MSTFFIERFVQPCRHGTVAVCLVLLAACASQPSAPTADQTHAVSKYAELRQGEAAALSNAAHIPPVLHSPEAEKQAQAATSDYVLGLQAMNAKQYKKAMVIFQSLTGRFPLLSGPWVNQGLIHLAEGRDKDAKAAFESALKVNDKNPYAWNALGMTERRLGDFPAAKTAYLKALTLDPLYARAHFNLAILADLYLDDLPLALEHYQRYQTLQQQPDKNVSIWVADIKRRIQETAPAVPEKDAQQNNNEKEAGTSPATDAKK